MANSHGKDHGKLVMKNGDTNKNVNSRACQNINLAT